MNLSVAACVELRSDKYPGVLRDRLFNSAWRMLGRRA